MSDYYREENGAPVPCTRAEWISQFRWNNRWHRVTYLRGQIRVSTIFLGLNHNFGDGPPLLYETMVFRGADGGDDCERYSTRAEAIAGHERMVERLIGKR